MALADKLAQRPDVIHGHACSVARLLERLEAPGLETELAAFETIMYGRAGLRETTRGARGWNERQVFEAVTEEGYEVAKSQINEHRGKRCRCYRGAA